MNKKLLLSVLMALALPANSDEIPEVYTENGQMVIDIPYLELLTAAGRQAYAGRLLASDGDYRFEVDWANLKTMDLQGCLPQGGETFEIAKAKLYIELNATDEDTGVHGTFGDHGWSKLCILDPDGRLLLEVGPRGTLGDLGMADIFFESREPTYAEYPIADIKANFPEGEYQVHGVSLDGKGIVGTMTFTHDIPEEPNITAPSLAEDEEAAAVATPVSVDGLVVTWESVTRDIDGGSLDIIGYEVILTDVGDAESSGQKTPFLDVIMAGDRTSFQVPAGFLRRGSIYELEVLALEESGNQTISVGFFATAE